MNPLLVSLLFISLILLFPFLFFCYILAPTTKIGKFLKQPCIKFLLNTVSYVIFIVLLIISSLQFAVDEKSSQRFSVLNWQFYDNYTNYLNNENFRKKFPLEDFNVRQMTPSNIDIAISIWVIGHCWHIFKQILRSGISEYMFSSSNMVDTVMNILYIASFSLKYYTIIVVTIEFSKVSSSDFWLQTNLNTTDTGIEKSLYETFYWLNRGKNYLFKLILK